MKMLITLETLWSSLICIIFSGIRGPPAELVISSFACQINNSRLETDNGRLDDLDKFFNRTCNQTFSGNSITGEVDQKNEENREGLVICKLIEIEPANTELKESLNDLGSPLYLTNLHNKSLVYSGYNYSCVELPWSEDYLILNTYIVCQTCANTYFVDNSCCTLVISIDKHIKKSRNGRKDENMYEINTSLSDNDLLLKLFFLLGLCSILFFRELIYHYQSRPTRILFDARDYDCVGHIRTAITRWLNILTHPAEMKQTMDNIIEVYNYMNDVQQNPTNCSKETLLLQEQRNEFSIKSSQNGIAPSKMEMKKSVSFVGDNSSCNEDEGNENGNCSDLENTRIQQELSDRRQTDVFILQHSLIQPGNGNSNRTSRHRCHKSTNLPRPILKRRQ